MPNKSAHYLQIREPDPDIELEFTLLAKRYKITQARLFEMLYRHAFEAVSRQLKEEKEERKEKENSAPRSAPRRRKKVGGDS